MMFMKERQQIINKYVKLSHVALYVILFNLGNKEIEATLKARYEKQGHTLCYLRVLVKHVKCSLKASTELSIFCIRFLKIPPSKHLLITV